MKNKKKNQKITFKLVGRVKIEVPEDFDYRYYLMQFLNKHKNKKGRRSNFMNRVTPVKTIKDESGYSVEIYDREKKEGPFDPGFIAGESYKALVYEIVWGYEYLSRTDLTEFIKSVDKDAFGGGAHGLSLFYETLTSKEFSSISVFMSPYYSKQTDEDFRVFNENKKTFDPCLFSSDDDISLYLDLELKETDFVRSDKHSSTLLVFFIPLWNNQVKVKEKFSTIPCLKPLKKSLR